MRLLMWIGAWLLMMAILSLFILWADLEYNSKVMSPAEKEAHFTKLKGKIFIGKEGKRPWITCREQRGKLEVHNGREWVRL
jgi:hypothetical protein